MIKIVLSIVVVAMIFIGCVGTVVANNDTNKNRIQNTKLSKNDTNNSTKKDNNTTSLKEMLK
jgi:PBP1b-binding outer membrane lipoprotein LpoB